MKILELNLSKYVLRDDLDEEDLICLLDLLRDVRNDYDGQPIDVSVGYRLPRNNKKEEPTL